MLKRKWNFYKNIIIKIGQMSPCHENICIKGSGFCLSITNTHFYNTISVGICMCNDLILYCTYVVIF